MRPSDPPIACTEARVNIVYGLCNDLLTSDQSTTVTVLIADLIRERDAAMIAFGNLVEAGEELKGCLDSANPPGDEEVAIILRFEDLLAKARRVN